MMSVSREKLKARERKQERSDCVFVSHLVFWELRT